MTFKVKNLRGSDGFMEAFLNKLQPEDEIEQILVKNNYISAKIKGKEDRVRRYYYIEAGIWIEDTKRRGF